MAASNESLSKELQEKTEQLQKQIELNNTLAEQSSEYLKRIEDLTKQLNAERAGRAGAVDAYERLKNERVKNHFTIEIYDSTKRAPKLSAENEDICLLLQALQGVTVTDKDTVVLTCDGCAITISRNSFESIRRDAINL